jgi:hypothetical protein
MFPNLSTDSIEKEKRSGCALLFSNFVDRFQHGPGLSLLIGAITALKILVASEISILHFFSQYFICSLYCVHIS